MLDCNNIPYFNTLKYMGLFKVLLKLKLLCKIPVSETTVSLCDRHYYFICNLLPSLWLNREIFRTIMHTGKGNLPWTGLPILGRYTKNARSWLLLTQVIFQGCFCSQQDQEQACLLLAIKCCVSPKSVLFCNATHCVCRFSPRFMASLPWDFKEIYINKLYHD